jgi:predicted GIY-YIG superfamily endonuclease
MAPKALLLDEVNCKTPCFIGSFAPHLHLEEAPDCEGDVVYILHCAPQIVGGPFTWYVGRCPRKKLSIRIRQHISGSATDFTAQNRPILLEGLYPAANKSVEAYAYYSMKEKLPANALAAGRLGGWTQTRPKPRQLCALLLQEQKRMLADHFLACNSPDHFVKDHPPNMPHHAAHIDCGHCSAIINVTALGNCTTLPPATRPKRAVAEVSLAQAAEPKP